MQLLNPSSGLAGRSFPDTLTSHDKAYLIAGGAGGLPAVMPFCISFIFACYPAPVTQPASFIRFYPWVPAYWHLDRRLNQKEAKNS